MIKRQLILFIIFSFTTIIASQGQTKYEGIWKLKTEPEFGVEDPLNQQKNYTQLFTDSTSGNDSLFKIQYFSCPHYINWSTNDVVLAYGDINNPNIHIIAKKYALRTFEGDCIFYWSPKTSMYEYLATWVQDHFIYYYSNEKEGVLYEKIDPASLNQHQRSLLNPEPDDIFYLQGRLRPMQTYYHCNIPTKN